MKKIFKFSYSNDKSNLPLTVKEEEGHILVKLMNEKITSNQNRTSKKSWFHSNRNINQERGES